MKNKYLPRVVIYKGGDEMNNVKTYRKQIKMTRKVLAEKTELSMSYIYFIETGERNPTISVACKIAQVLKQPLDNLFPPDSITK